MKLLIALIVVADEARQPIISVTQSAITIFIIGLDWMPSCLIRARLSPHPIIDNKDVICMLKLTAWIFSTVTEVGSRINTEDPIFQELNG